MKRTQSLLAVLARRVFRGLRIRSSRMLSRVCFFIGLRRPSNIDFQIFPWSSLAGPPGNPAVVSGRIPISSEADVAPLFEEVISHRLRIFKEDPIDVSTTTRQLEANTSGRFDSVSQRGLPAYIPIDWQRDFFSGYRWSCETYFQDITPAPLPGVEIKVPRELSRFQHVGALVYGPKEKASSEFILQVTDWIAANPYGRGVNWECSMDVALRAINWIWGLRLFEVQLEKNLEFQRLVGNSLRDHGRHIYENLDYYGEDVPTNNHYLADVAGLAYIGAVLPDIPEADLWLAYGVQELLSEMRREVLKDGVCHEASTSYHRLVTELFASTAALIERLPVARRQRLARLAVNTNGRIPRLKRLLDCGDRLVASGQVLPEWFYARLLAMVEFSLAMRKPNGVVSTIGDNDSARVHKLFPALVEETRNHDHLFSVVGELLGRDDLVAAGNSAAPEGQLVSGGLRVKAICDANSHAQSPIRCFLNAGIAVQVIGDAWLAVTCGPSGQGGRGGHGHNDKNSFELNVKKLDFVVDGGCAAYTSDPLTRNTFRSTAMHSTIHLTHIEQNRWSPGVGGLFQLLEKAEPSLHVENDAVIVGCHRGYGAPHSRRFKLDVTGLLIEDEFVDDRERYLVFNLHPDVSVTFVNREGDKFSFALQHAAGVVIGLSVVGCESFELMDGAYSTGYLRRSRNQRLSLRLKEHRARSVVTW